MAEGEKLGLRLRVFLFFALLICAAAALIGGGMYLAATKLGPGSAGPLALGGGAAWFGLALVTLWVWQKFDENVARPIMRLSHELERESTASAARAGVDTQPARYLGMLGPAIQTAARALAAERAATEECVETAVREAEAARARLESILRDLNEAVVLCNREHQVLLYNHEAVRLLGAREALGLGRPLGALVVEEPVRHALDRLERRFAEGRHRAHPDGLSIAVLTSTPEGGRTLAGRISLVTDAEEEAIDGFAVTLSDATQRIAAEAERDRLISAALEALNPPLTALSAIGEIVGRGEEIAPETRRALDAAIATETRTAADEIAALTERQGSLRSGAWPMADVFSPTLFACVRGRIGPDLASRVTVEGENLWLHAESFSIVEVLAGAIGILMPARGDIVLAASARGGNVFVDLMWQGAPVSLSAVERCLAQPLENTLGGLTARDVLARHRTELWPDRAPDGRARLRLPLRTAIHDHRGAPAMPLPKRPEFYDFDLMNRALPADMAGRGLRELTYVVFDTETTGLNPGQGDEIVQIAGVRIVNGRLLRGEVFDELVHPGRTIPAASTRVHHITNEMVADKPPVEPVLRRFHAFTKGAVLIAHNAAFDMRFLELKQDRAGVAFDNPVLDTVLLSALISDQGAEHTLDALAERFGITLKPEERHTALGDSIATGEAFLRMLDLLAARGVRTLAEAQEASDTMVALRRKQSY